jgi:hypothetical protein
LVTRDLVCSSKFPIVYYMRSRLSIYLPLILTNWPLVEPIRFNDLSYIPWFTRCWKLLILLCRASLISNFRSTVFLDALLKYCFTLTNENLSLGVSSSKRSFSSLALSQLSPRRFRAISVARSYKRLPTRMLPGHHPPEKVFGTSARRPLRKLPLLVSSTWYVDLCPGRVLLQDHF